jgi:glucosamine-6-phosphate deaminase
MVHISVLNTILAAMKQLKSQSYMHDCWLWLWCLAWGTSRNRYGSAFKSKRSTIEKKRYFLPSSKDRVMYQGNDSREFWVRAEDRNKHTALYDELGLPEYEAIEAFKRFDY